MMTPEQRERMIDQTIENATVPVDRERIGDFIDCGWRLGELVAMELHHGCPSEMVPEMAYLSLCIERGWISA